MTAGEASRWPRTRVLSAGAFQGSASADESGVSFWVPGFFGLWDMSALPSDAVERSHSE
jgi:hypothetical protein